MNIANLQIQGLVMAVAHINQALVKRGILSIDDVDSALAKTEASLTAEERVFEDMDPAQRDALCFPVRLLKRANLGQSEDFIQSFSELTKEIGRSKEPYNDQRRGSCRRAVISKPITGSAFSILSFSRSKPSISNPTSVSERRA
jgi:hypothetical protein